MTTITDQKLDELQALCEAANLTPDGAVFAKYIATAAEALPSLIKRVRELEAEILSLHEDAAGADI